MAIPIISIKQIRPKAVCIHTVFLLILLSIFIFLFVFHVETNNAFAACGTVEECSSEAAKYEKLIADAQKQASSLSREISIIGNNISLKEVQIRQAEKQIEEKEKELVLLTEDIRLLEVRLDRLDDQIDDHQDRLALRMRKQYIDNQYSHMELLISAESISDFISRIKYLELIQAEDKELINRMNSTKESYESQQKVLEEKKQQVEEIKKEIESQKLLAVSLKSALEQQKSYKDNLLRITKNDEKRYTSLLEEARKELAQIQSAANVVIREGEGVDVEKGEAIGTMGNSGYSTGAHLHFGVYNYSVDDFKKESNWGWYYSNSINPIDKLESKTVKWTTGCSRDPSGDEKTGKGDWDWPMSNVRITQNYGYNTCYNWMYGGKIHPAIDLVGYGDITIRSVADGKAYFCRNCLGDGGNGVFIFHSGNKMSVYWHLK